MVPWHFGDPGLNSLSSRDKFFFQLQWVLALEKRYVNILQAGLVHIACDPVDVQKITFGAQDAAVNFDDAETIMRVSFRATDLIARVGFDFWILTPFTEADPVTQKIENLLGAAAKSGVAIARHQINVHLLKNYLAEEKKAAPEAMALLQQIKASDSLKP